MTPETQLRFLRAISEKVTVDRVVEVHLFAPRRHGATETGVAVVAAASPELENAHERHVVFSARYRLAIKGPDRGKWDLDCVAEADAPLVTVDAVVRGVMDRAGDAGDPERLSAEQWRAALEEPTWAAPA